VQKTALLNFCTPPDLRVQKTALLNFCTPPDLRVQKTALLNFCTPPDQPVTVSGQFSRVYKNVYSSKSHE